MFRRQLNLVDRHMESQRLAVAFLLSLLVHIVLFAGWRTGRANNWWQFAPAWSHVVQKKLNALTTPRTPPPPPAQPREIPLTFVEVDPALATEEAPKEAKFYSAQNSQAANPEQGNASRVKIDGSQTKVPKTFETLKPVKTQPAEEVKPKPAPLQPTPPRPEPEKTEVAKESEPPKPPEPKPAEPVPPEPAKTEPEPVPAKAVELPQELAMTRPPEKVEPAPTAPQPPHTRPRTLREARQQRGLLVGQKSQQEGGVHHLGHLTVDAKATPFGAYDNLFIAAVQQRWYDLLENSQIVTRPGKVELEFRLSYDGRITDMTVGNNEVGEMLSWLCQRAVLDPAPYPKWPSDMRRMVGSNYREVKFTFYYN